MIRQIDWVNSSVVNLSVLLLLENNFSNLARMMSKKQRTCTLNRYHRLIQTISLVSFFAGAVVDDEFPVGIVSNNILTKDFDQRYLYWAITRWTISWFDLKQWEISIWSFQKNVNSRTQLEPLSFLVYDLWLDAKHWSFGFVYSFVHRIEVVVDRPLRCWKDYGWRVVSMIQFDVDQY